MLYIWLDWRGKNVYRYSVCVEFQKEFSTVNLKFKKDDEKGYEYSLIVLYTLETERGYKVKKIGKTTGRGTKVSYIPFKDDEDVKKYSEFLQGIIKEFNEKWNAYLKLV